MNQLDPPKMPYDYYEKRTDLEDNIYGLNYIVNLIKNIHAFKCVVAKLNPCLKCNNFQFKSEDYWVCLSKYLTSIYYHQYNTCRMGDTLYCEL